MVGPIFGNENQTQQIDDSVITEKQQNNISQKSDKSSPTVKKPNKRSKPKKKRSGNGRLVVGIIALVFIVSISINIFGVDDIIIGFVSQFTAQMPTTLNHISTTEEIFKYHIQTESFQYDSSFDMQDVEIVTETWIKYNPSLLLKEDINASVVIVIVDEPHTDGKIIDVDSSIFGKKIMSIHLVKEDCNGKHVKFTDEAIRAELLYQFGHVYGLTDSKNPKAVVYNHTDVRTIVNNVEVPPKIDVEYRFESEIELEQKSDDMSKNIRCLYV